MGQASVTMRLRVMRKFSLTFIIYFFYEGIHAQCAMCRAVVEQGGEEVAEGINSGIVYLMAFPYLIAAVSIYLFYRNWKKTSAG